MVDDSNLVIEKSGPGIGLNEKEKLGAGNGNCEEIIGSPLEQQAEGKGVGQKMGSWKRRAKGVSRLNLGNELEVQLGKRELSREDRGDDKRNKIEGFSTTEYGDSYFISAGRSSSIGWSL